VKLNCWLHKKQKAPEVAFIHSTFALVIQKPDKLKIPGIISTFSFWLQMPSIRLQELTGSRRALSSK
jgi:hypothetical protein